MFSVDWIIRNRQNFLEFSRILRECKNPRIYQTDFIHALVDEFWRENQENLQLKFFAPWLSYMICTFYLFSTVAFEGIYNENDDTEDKIYKYSLTGLTLLLYSYQLVVEVQQFASLEVAEYIQDSWNWINISHFVTAAYVYFTMFVQNEEILDHWTTGAVRSLALLTLWSNFFDWLRLFDRTSFLIKLVSKTFVDIIEFMVLFLIALAMVGSAMYALQYAQGPVNENVVIEPIFGFFFFDLIYNQYMLALGEFATGGFDEHPNKNLTYLLFIFATLFTQVVFLNMLIAIMGNTFDSVMEKKH